MKANAQKVASWNLLVDERKKGISLGVAPSVIIYDNSSVLKQDMKKKQKRINLKRKKTITVSINLYEQHINFFSVLDICVIPFLVEEQYFLKLVAADYNLHFPGISPQGKFDGESPSDACCKTGSFPELKHIYL